MQAGCQCPAGNRIVIVQSADSRSEQDKGKRASNPRNDNDDEQANSLLGGSGSAAALSTTRGCRGRAAAAAASSSCGVRQDGQPLSTLGPQVSPTAVSCTTQVQSSTVVVARTSQSFIRDRAAAAEEEEGGNLSLSPPGAAGAAALPPDATFHPMDHGPKRKRSERHL